MLPLNKQRIIKHLRVSVVTVVTQVVTKSNVDISSIYIPPVTTVTTKNNKCYKKNKK